LLTSETGTNVQPVAEIVQDMREQRAAVLLISTELEEILALSDRIAVIYEGQIMGILPGDRSLTKTIGLMMAGVGENGAA
jgi:ABC-type uncharacterized transport system ATPase subunit